MSRNSAIALGLISLVCLSIIAVNGCYKTAHSDRDTAEHPHAHAHTAAIDHTHPSDDATSLASSHGADHDHDHDHALMHPSHDPFAPCRCDLARLHNGWCQSCNVGYIATVQIDSEILYSTLDPHGHDLDLDLIVCETCRHAIDKDGYCDPCGMGFVRGKAFFSRLTHGLASGSAVDPVSPACKACRIGSDEPRWCDRCARGAIGNTAFNNKETFKRTAQEYTTLLAAIEKTEDCELCACAMTVYRTCPTCFVSYEPDSPGIPENDPMHEARLAPPSE